MRYAKIDECEVVNGIGCGTSIYVQGCHFRCPGCFNSEAWDFNGGKKWTNEIEDEFLELINRPYIKRVSILGGEPFSDENVGRVHRIVDRIKSIYPDKKIWLYTGYTFDLLQNKFYEYQYTPFAPGADEWLTRWEIISMVNVLVDGRFEEDKKDLTLVFCGSSNQRIIDVKKSLEKGEVVLWTP